MSGCDFAEHGPELHPVMPCDRVTDDPPLDHVRLPATGSRNSARQALLLELLTAHRIAAGLTQEEVAQRLRRPQSFVSKYELGERRLDVVELLEVCAALGTDARKLIGELLKASSD